MSGGFEFVVHTGNRDADWQTASTYKQQYAASGMSCDVQPTPDGGFQVVVNGGSGAAAAAPAAPQAAAQGFGQPAAQAAYGQPPPDAYGQGQQAAYGQAAQGGYGQPSPGAGQNPWNSGPVAGGGAPAFAMAGGGAVAGTAGVGMADAVKPLGIERVKYLRKVYGLLFAAAAVAVLAGFAVITFMGQTEPVYFYVKHPEVPIALPKIVGMMVDSPGVMWGIFGALVAATFVASWASKKPVINVIMLFVVAALMGLDLAPMAFIAQLKAGFGDTLTTAPLRDAAIMTGMVFIGITAYIFVTRKDFSYLRAILSMGFWVVLGACLLSFVFKSEMFALAVASVGALLSIGFLLYVTSYIFRNSKMDDAVGDALALLVQLRNLFMFLLRIFMSSRD